MGRTKLLSRITILMFFMFFMFLLERKFHWYYTIWWFDMPMHFFGGMWVGLFFMYVYKTQNLNLKSILKIVLSLLVIGILWEIFELYVFNGIGHYPFNLLDTISDVLFDISGGFFALLYFSKRIMFNEESTVQL